MYTIFILMIVLFLMRWDLQLFFRCVKPTLLFTTNVSLQKNVQVAFSWCVTCLGLYESYWDQFDVHEVDDCERRHTSLNVWKPVCAPRCICSLPAAAGSGIGSWWHSIPACLIIECLTLSQPKITDSLLTHITTKCVWAYLYFCVCWSLSCLKEIPVWVYACI